jgi:hypothetical protein
VGVQEARRDRDGGTDAEGDYAFFCGNWNESNEVGTGSVFT